MAFVKRGSYVSLYDKKSLSIHVDDFLMDVYPVTNGQYASFVKDNPAWRRSKVKKIFADDNYLAGWTNDSVFNENQEQNAPVTNVSWYAANIYCACLGKRLPTIDEWEYAALANETVADARDIKSYNQFILEQYEKPFTYLNEVGSNQKNYWGIYDLHGLAWEWVADFSAVLISGESRKDGSTDKNIFCGSGSLGAKDLMNYAAFMRYAFRGSLKADYGVKTLGFRCVKNIIIKP